jgi:hypothetical protein
MSHGTAAQQNARPARPVGQEASEGNEGARAARLGASPRYGVSAPAVQNGPILIAIVLSPGVEVAFAIGAYPCARLALVRLCDAEFLDKSGTSSDFGTVIPKVEQTVPEADKWRSGSHWLRLSSFFSPSRRI